MANVEHLERLQQGVQAWNQWRLNYPKIRPELSGSTLFAAQLSGANLSGARLRRVRWDKADLRGANLYKADLSGAHLPDANLDGANLSKARLRGTRLNRAELSGADLSRARLPASDLSDANLSGADLSDANLSGAQLRSANLGGANLSNAWLISAQVTGTIFSQAMFTGACIRGWQPNSTTVLEGIICDYIYLKGFQKERRPRNGVFKPGEFAKLFRYTMGIIDINFGNSIDWQALLNTVKQLRHRYGDPLLSIQAIEKKRGGRLTVRVEMSPNTDASVLKQRIIKLYGIKLRAMDARYRHQARSQGHPLEIARLHIDRERQDKANLMGIVDTLAHSQQGPVYRRRARQQSVPTTANSTTREEKLPRPSQKVSSSRVEPIQTKVIEMLLSGDSSSTIARMMQLESGLDNRHQKQSDFRVIFWRAFFNKVLELVRLSMTSLSRLIKDKQLLPSYRLWLLRWWIEQFSILLDDQGTPQVSIRQSEIIHLLLFGMTPKEIGSALMINPKQILRQKRQPAFRVTFWDAYCHRLFALITKVTETTIRLLRNQQLTAKQRLMILHWQIEKFPESFDKTLERIELERILCVLISISAGQFFPASAPLDASSSPKRRMTSEMVV